MDKNIYNVFVNLSTTKISVATFKDSRSQSISFKEYDCAIDFSDDEFNYQVIKKTIEEFIFETEKITDSFLNDIYLMIDLPGLKKISLSLMKDHEGNKIEIKDIQYLVQDARQQILSFNNDKEIIHIIIKSYNLDNIRYKNLPKEINCRKFSLDIEFICLSKILNFTFLNFLAIRLVPYSNLSHSLFNPHLSSLVPLKIVQVEVQKHCF